MRLKLQKQSALKFVSRIIQSREAEGLIPVSSESVNASPQMKFMFKTMLMSYSSEPTSLNAAKEERQCGHLSDGSSP